MSKLERLLNLIAALLDTPRPLRIDEIRSRVEGYPDGDDAYKRAFERDKEELRAMGIPISVQPVPGTDPPRDGYRIERGDYAGTDPQLAVDELAALHLAATLVRLEGVDGEDALRRLGGVVGSGDGDRSDVVSAGEELEGSRKASPLAAIPTPEALGPLFEAARDGRAVAFDYGGEGRLLEPWTVTFTRGRWYVAGLDQGRGAERRFRVDRIDGPVAVQGPAGSERPPADQREVRLSPWQMGDDEPVRARVAIDADQAPWATHHLGADAVTTTEPDGGIVVELDVTNRDAFRSFVLTFLEHAEVLDPPELRDDLVQWLERLAS